MPQRRPRHRAPRPARRFLFATLLVVPVALVFGFTAIASRTSEQEVRTLAHAGQARPATPTTEPISPSGAMSSFKNPNGRDTNGRNQNDRNQNGRDQNDQNQNGFVGHRHRKREDPPPPQNPPQTPPNPNCTLAVPSNPLTAQGLATPYVLTGTESGGPCHEADAAQSAFVEATILDPATGKLLIYRPLVIDRGTRPAAAPVMPTLPAGAVVGIWFGFNGDTLTLADNRNSLAQGSCVNGLGDSLFGQFAHCNAPAFFAAADSAIARNQLVIPPVGTAKDGMPCPTVRDFSLVDQDQSDNVTTTYVATPDGRTAQAAAGSARLGKTTTLTNGSDNRLLDAFVDPALGCTPFTAPDLTAGGAPSTSLALNELQAAAHQAQPVALVPPNDPMVQVDGKVSIPKANLYRAGVDQPPVNPAVDTPVGYCTNITAIGAKRLAMDMALLTGAASPDAAANLYEFLTQRLQTSLQNLNCPAPG